MSTRRVHRRARLPGPAMPGGELVLETPPELPRMLPRNLRVMALPAMMIVSSIGFVFVGGLSATATMMGALVAVSTLGMVAGGAGTGSHRPAIDQERRDYLRYLEQVRGTARRARADQRAALEWRHPHPRALLTVAGSRRIWERRRSHPDFLRVRIARGRQRLALRLVAPETGPVEELEPVSTVALRRLVRGHAVVPDLPLTAQLRGFAAVSIGGEAGAARGLARSMLAELMTFHAPEDLLVAVVTDATRIHEWEWVKWAPHAQHPRLCDAAGSRRLIGESLAEVEDWLATELANRARFSRTMAAVDGTYVLVVVDGGQIRPNDRLLAEDGIAGVTALDLSGSMGALSPRRRLCLQVQDGQVGALSTRGVEWLGALDALSVAEAEAVARRLAPVRLGSSEARTDEPLLTATELTDLLGIVDVATAPVVDLWAPRAPRDRLRVPIGVSDTGEPVELDLKEAALDGMGPHGLVIGATGSGKSELLRTIVLGLAASHSPQALNFVLVDFKGGATFAGLQALPHTAAAITNLAADLSMVDRMRDALSGELNRRQEMLRAAGNLANVGDYERARENGADLPPLPTLVIVCDEFSEMLSQKPEFADLFVMVGRLGRSLAIHLLLASQRLEEGRLRGLDSHLSYRIGLKTFSAAESRIVLGVPDAYELPPIPGSGYLKHDTAPMVRFKAAYVSGAYRTSTDVVDDSGSAGRSIRPFRAGFVAAPASADPITRPRRTVLAETVLDAIVQRLAGHGPSAHEVWLAPLSSPPTLDQLVPPLTVTAARGLCAPGWPGNGRLRLPLAVVDKPFEQRRDELVVDLSGAAGHVAVAGSPQAGKSTALRSLVSMLALTHTPDELQVYCVDLGGGSLTSLRALPHVGVVAGRHDGELVRRTVAEMTALVARRETAFREAGLESMAAFRRRRDAGGYRDPHGDVFLVIDGWLPFRQEFEELEAQVGALAGQGLSYGVHLVLSVNRWADLRSAIRDQIGTRIELRLGDPADSDVDRRVAETVPTGQPGRGLTAKRHHLLVALPRVDSEATAADLTEAVADLVRRIDGAWRADPARRGAPPVRILPERVEYEELPATADDPHGLPIAVNQAELTPVFLDVDNDALFLVFGDSRSGKSSFLRLVSAGIVERYMPEQARILAVDYRRNLLDLVPAEYLAGYAVNAPAATALLSDLRGLLEARLPGPDVTPEQLRRRSWWSGREVFVLVDDYDLVATPSANPLAALLDLLPQARDVGLHLVLCRRSGGAARALFEPVVQRMRELGASGLVLSGSPDECALLGSARPAPLAPGRGFLVGRRGEAQLVQVAYRAHGPANRVIHRLADRPARHRASVSN